MSFNEGDVVRFYYKDKPVFLGFVFTKQRDREGRINVTCYDQLRYLKNKYTYVFENKTATQITQALCNDFNLKTGSMDNTSYVIPKSICPGSGLNSKIPTLILGGIEFTNSS